MTNQVGRNERYKQFFVGYENGFVGVSFWRDRDETPHSIDHIELRAVVMVAPPQSSEESENCYHSGRPGLNSMLVFRLSNLELNRSVEFGRLYCYYNIGGDKTLGIQAVLGYDHGAATCG